MFVCLRATLNIDDALLDRARELTGVREKTSLVRMGLEALIARESAARLAALADSEKHVRRAPRRRGSPAAPLPAVSPSAPGSAAPGQPPV